MVILLTAHCLDVSMLDLQSLTTSQGLLAKMKKGSCSGRAACANFSQLCNFFSTWFLMFFSLFVLFCDFFIFARFRAFFCTYFVC